MEQMLKKYNEMKAALFHEGFLDETFKILEGMRDDKNPEFPFEMLSIFLMNATKMLHDLRRAVTPSTEDICKADALVHDIKGICLRCIATAHQLMDEYSLFKQRIDSLMKPNMKIRRTFKLFIIPMVDVME
ncbi:hypothetical protein LUZ61_016044 [Rhynchospora tenuis]|uniref:Histidine-containing phosphotransfer protein n=1 Tax=Rhynchospora tenuis TaxID=198213 RepID=A0AAD6EJF3_9POAL|nr:hypothetical protein LUZ61_016044 [Rhynchospora tenuis]